MKPLNSKYKSEECCAATDAELHHDKYVNYFHPIMQHDAVRNQSITPRALLQDDGVMQTHLKKIWHLATSWKNCTFRGESSKNLLRIMGLEYDNSIFLSHILHGFPFAYHVSLIILCRFPLFKTFCPDVPFIHHHNQLYLYLEYFHYLLWVMHTCRVIQEIYFCSGEIILLLTLKLKYHGKLLSEYIFVVCKW